MEHPNDSDKDIPPAADPAFPPSILKVSGAALILQGILLLLLGILLFFSPVATIRFITVLIGVILAADGIFLLFFRPEGKKIGNAVIVNSIALIVLGALTVLMPLWMDMLWVIAIGAWQLYVGVLTLVSGSWKNGLGIFSAILSLIVGFLLIAAPWIGLLSLIWVIALLLIFSSVFMIGNGIRMRKL